MESRSEAREIPGKPEDRQREERCKRDQIEKEGRINIKYTSERDREGQRKREITKTKKSRKEI